MEFKNLLEKCKNRTDVLIHFGYNEHCLKCKMKQFDSIKLKDINAFTLLNSNFHIKTVLKNLKILKVDAIEQKKLKKEVKLKKPLIESYFDFINCATLEENSKEAIKIPDATDFCNFLTQAPQEPLIDKFVEKLMNDSLDYPKEIRSEYFDVLIFCYIYCLRNKLNMKKIKKKVDSCKFMFSKTKKYLIDLTEDKYINRFLYQIKKCPTLYDEVMLLNHIFINAREENEIFKEKFTIFLRRCDADYLLDGLKIIFTYNTITYNIINQNQLLNMVVSFFKKQQKGEIYLQILKLLMIKTDNNDYRNILKNECLDLKIDSLKLKKLHNEIEIENFVEISEFEKYFNKNKDSFDAITAGVNDLQEIFKIIEIINKDDWEKIKFDEIDLDDLKQTVFLQIFKLVINLYNILKIDFFVSLFTTIFSLITSICKKIAVNQNFVDFNQKYWNLLSKILLFGERLGISNNQVKGKKKCNDLSISHKTKLTQKLWIELKQLEKLAIKKGYKDIKKLKKKGFEIKDKLEE
ncbi:hypothetical protein NUSPORA_00190 [Nucleospora cyclopteri]